MKSALLLSLLFFLSSTAHANRHLHDDDILYQKLNQEIQKDLNGEPSCFKGKVKDKFLFMQDNYGGRFGDSYNLDVLRIFETIFRSNAKYCDWALDSDMNRLPQGAHDSLKKYRECINTDSSTSVAAITFDASTSGTLEKEGLIFSIRYDVTNDLIVDYDASYHPEDSEIKSWKTFEDLECTIIE
jgi:hypothetical protein